MMAKVATIEVDVTYQLTQWMFDVAFRRKWERAVNRAYWRLKK